MGAVVEGSYSPRMGCIVAAYYTVVIMLAGTLAAYAWRPLGLIVIALGVTAHVCVKMSLKKHDKVPTAEVSEEAEAVGEGSSGFLRAPGGAVVVSCVGVVALVVAGVAFLFNVVPKLFPEEPEPTYAPPSSYAGVIDRTGSSAYRVLPDAIGGQDLVGRWYMRLNFEILNANQTRIDPVITVEGKDASVVICRTDDLRRQPPLVRSTTDWDFPCSGSLPEPSLVLSVVVTEGR